MTPKTPTPKKTGDTKPTQDRLTSSTARLRGALSRFVTDGEPAATVDIETLLAALDNERRRHTLRLCEADATTLDTLATRIAAIENGIPESAVGGQQRKRVHVSLYQTHLPKLREWGLLDEQNRLTPAGEVAIEALATLMDMPEVER